VYETIYNVPFKTLGFVLIPEESTRDAREGQTGMSKVNKPVNQQLLNYLSAF